MATLSSGIAGQGGPPSRGPDPPELPSGVHAKRKNQVIIFCAEGVVVGVLVAADDELIRTPLNLQTRLRR